MLDKARSFAGRISARVANLPAPALAVAGLVIVAGVGGGGVYAYRTYDYVQHDNDFCLSCHLMEQPFERFSLSAHRGLGCKACHQPTIVARSQMALTQIIENPEQLAAHAEVPNDRCAECHIRGDPQEWRRTANTVGHKIHLESSDPSLQGLRCVECHSTSLHEFSPSDRTCGQAGCHDDIRIQLGAMSGLTIHCVACHAFLAPAPGTEALTADTRAEIRPDRDTCLSCHAMRERVQMPDPDPHQGECASCHNPHVQSTPAEAAQSCATAQCHAPADLQRATPFHRGLRPGVLEGCTTCHQAHDFSLDGSDCAGCHQDIAGDSASAPARSASLGGSPHQAPGSSRSATGSTELAVRFASYLHDSSPVVAEARPNPMQQATSFTHARHQGIPCTSCHTSAQRHGELSVTTLEDCRGCHHTAPLSSSCARCHDAGDTPAGPIGMTRTMTFSVRPEARRELPFRHEAHSALDCGSCHTRGSALSAADVACTQCHEQHHDAANRCASCHRQPPSGAHPPAEAHVTCTGSGCHVSTPFEGVPRTREACLVCHQTRREHQPGRLCADCHQLPAPRAGGG